MLQGSEVLEAVAAAMDEANTNGVRELYLFSKDIGSCFECMGWRSIDVRHAVNMLSSAQVRHYNDIGWYADERTFVLNLSGSDK